MDEIVVDDGNNILVKLKEMTKLIFCALWLKTGNNFDRKIDSKFIMEMKVKKKMNSEKKISLLFGELLWEFLFQIPIRYKVIRVICRKLLYAWQMTVSTHVERLKEL